MSYLQSLARTSLIGSVIFSSCAVAIGQEPEPPKESKRVVISFDIDDGPLRIVISGDDVKVELNGKEIARDRLDLEDNWLQIKNKRGWPVAFGSFGEDNFGFNFIDAPKTHAWLGVDLKPVSEALAEHLGLDRDEVSLIVSVTPDSPAQQGGLHERDIMLGFEGKSPATGEDLREILADKDPGDLLEISLLRKGKEEKIQIELGESAGPSRAVGGFSRALYDGIGKGGVYSYTLPNFEGSWRNLLNYNKALLSLNKAKGDHNLIRLFWGVDKNKNAKDKNGQTKTMVIPGGEVYSILGGTGQGSVIGTRARYETSTQTLESQLDKMAKELEELKFLIQKQQGKAKKQDH